VQPLEARITVGKLYACAPPLVDHDARLHSEANRDVGGYWLRRFAGLTQDRTAAIFYHQTIVEDVPVQIPVLDRQ
jgi:hypothetical protein